MRAHLVLVGALVIPTLLSGQQAETRLLGRVFGPDGREPIAGVAVSINNATAVTDARGAFVLSPAPSGRHLVKFEMLSYVTREDSVTLMAGGTNEITVRLTQKPIALPPVSVTVRPRWLEQNGYFDRREKSGLSGRFIETEEIERKAPTFLTDLLGDVSGARIHNGFSRRVVRFNREAQKGLGATVFGGPPPTTDPFELWLVKLHGCQPDVFIDGRRHQDRIISKVGAYVDDFNMLSPAIVSAIEVYVGANTPIEYRSSTGCGVILIWTKKS